MNDSTTSLKNAFHEERVDLKAFILESTDGIKDSIKAIIQEVIKEEFGKFLSARTSVDDAAGATSCEFCFNACFFLCYHQSHFLYCSSYQ